ncbi:hypothetical protein ACFFJX_14375 [Pseudarcicella hirudinis]|uniref:hypothetical protein n=1 Tax=Pseudarcicella hirudinis TaxID=1079859 RepID=UPI0035E86794
MKFNIKSNILLLLILLMNAFGLKAQSRQIYSLQQLIESAMKTNQLLTIKDWQILEKKSKLREDNIKNTLRLLWMETINTTSNLQNLPFLRGYLAL